jgi:hypothetical protein
MTNNKQSSVEWLQLVLVDTILTHEQVMQTIGLFEQAKEMEKEQIVDAWISDRQFIIWSGDKDEFTDDEINELANDYYEQTYGGNK